MFRKGFQQGPRARTSGPRQREHTNKSPLNTNELQGHELRNKYKGVGRNTLLLEWNWELRQEMELPSRHHPFLQAPGSRGLFLPSANPTFEQRLALMHQERSESTHVHSGVLHFMAKTCPPAPQSTRTNGTGSSVSNVSSLQRTGNSFSIREDHTQAETHTTELESSSCGLAAGRGSSPLLTVPLGVCSAPVSPGTACKGFVFCSQRKWLLQDCCKPILLKDILFVLIL